MVDHDANVQLCVVPARPLWIHRVPAGADYQWRLHEPVSVIDAPQFLLPAFGVDDDQLEALPVARRRRPACGLQHLLQLVLLYGIGLVAADAVAFLDQLRECHNFPPKDPMLSDSLH